MSWPGTETRYLWLIECVKRAFQSSSCSFLPSPVQLKTVNGTLKSTLELGLLLSELLPCPVIEEKCPNIILACIWGDGQSKTSTKVEGTGNIHR